eukprot:SAG11_NODE_3085_length_2705_cov_2.939754_4_plen_140_part_00
MVHAIQTGTTLIAAASLPVFNSLYASLTALMSSLDGDTIRGEVALFQQVLNVNRAQHRRTIHIRKLVEVSRGLKALLRMPVVDVANACRDLIGAQLGSQSQRLAPGAGYRAPSQAELPCTSVRVDTLLPPPPARPRAPS